MCVSALRPHLLQYGCVDVSGLIYRCARPCLSLRASQYVSDGVVGCLESSNTAEITLAKQNKKWLLIQFLN